MASICTRGDVCARVHICMCVVREMCAHGREGGKRGSVCMGRWGEGKCVHGGGWR